ncbi:short-chain fatty acid transporter [Immundisolibacter sp.]|uniref:short-chain fatty acid transporter n=2 Tax=Immundisolibacter sp. TaxID=1934948 RepID=UPI003566799B
MLQRLGAGLSRLSERYVPDAWIICLILTLIVFGLAWAGPGADPLTSARAWGNGVWTLLTLAMQFTLALVAAHACATATPVYRALDWLARLPNPASPRQAVLLVGLFSLLTGWLNWALSLVACALFVPFVLRRNPLADVRVVLAAGYLGLGTVWHGGLSGSAPLILATPGNPLLGTDGAPGVVSRLYPITETLLIPFNLVLICVVGVVGLAVVCLLHPTHGARTVDPDTLNDLLPEPPSFAPPATPAQRLDNFPGWTWLAAALLAYPLGYAIVTQGFGASWTINAYNAVFLAAALLLHGRPTAFLAACRNGTQAAWGIILQFPFYGGIYGVLQHTGLGRWLGELFAGHASTASYPLLVYLYSAAMNLFVPSAGSKWILEAPFLIPAGEALGVSPITTLLAYCYGDSTTNLIQPFFAIPLLAVMRVRFADILGYTAIVAAVCLVINMVAMLFIPRML